MLNGSWQRKQVWETASKPRGWLRNERKWWWWFGWKKMLQKIRLYATRLTSLARSILQTFIGFVYSGPMFPVDCPWNSDKTRQCLYAVRCLLAGRGNREGGWGQINKCKVLIGVLVKEDFLGRRMPKPKKQARRSVNVYALKIKRFIRSTVWFIRSTGWFIKSTVWWSEDSFHQKDDAH